MYKAIQYVIYQTPIGDSLYIIGDWNAKVGKDISNCITGNFVQEREPEELCNNIRNLLKEITYKKVPKVKRKKVSKCLS